MKTKWSQESYTRAWRFAAEAHQGQTLPGTDLPYLVHIGTVAMEVIAALAVAEITDPDLAVQCALLHDVIEDTMITYEQVKAIFGTAVADGVLALSKDKALPNKRTQMIDSLARIQQQPAEVWIVKMADRIANLQQPPSHWTKEKANAYREEAMLICEALRAANSFLADRLQSKIDGYQAYVE